MKPCRSDAQALEHEGSRDATGAEVSLGAQERAMPEPQPQQAKRAVGASTKGTAARGPASSVQCHGYSLAKLRLQSDRASSHL